MWFSRFIAPIYSVRELLYSLLKSANFLKICDTYYRGGKYSKSFLWICNLAAVDNITADGGIVTGKDYRFIWLPEFVTPICNVRELLQFLFKLANFPENWDRDCWWNERFGFSPLIWARTSGINRLNRAYKRLLLIPYGISWLRRERVFGNITFFPWRYIIR